MNRKISQQEFFLSFLIPQECVCPRPGICPRVFAFTYHRLVSISPDKQSQERSEDQLQTKAKQCFACSNKGFIYLLFVYPVHLSPEIQNSESIHLFGKRLKKFPLS